MKNKKKANIILIGLMAAFLLLAVLKHYFGEIFIIRFLIFVVEAALVGSIADWFAVTALFEKPLGLPIKPIIPSNREKILSNLSSVINNNLLDMDYIQNTVEKIPISKILVDWTENKAVMHQVKNFLLTQLFKVMKKLKNDKTKLIIYLKEKTKNVDSAKAKVLKLVNKLIEKRFTKEVYNELLDKGIMFLNKAETMLKLYNFLEAKINTKAGNRLQIFGGTKTFVDTAKLATAIQSEAIYFLEELKTNNKNYNDIKFIIDKYSKEYFQNTDLESMMNNFIDKFLTDERLDTILMRIEDFLTSLSHDNISASKSQREAMATIVKELIEDLWLAIRNDSDTLLWIDSLVKGLIVEVIARNRLEFSRFIDERIKGFTDSQLSVLIENTAEEPLHWIRINGAILGALLGIILFSFINFLYDPYILPLSHKITL